MDYTSQLIEEYYKIKSQDEIEAIRNSEIFNRDHNLKKRKEAYNKQLSLINELQKKFKTLVNARNELAISKGYDNYFTFIANWDGISEEEISQFNKNYKNISESIFLFFLKQKKLDWLGTKFNNLDLSWLAKPSEFVLPDDVLQAFTKLFPSFSSKVQKIKFKNKNYRYYYASYDFAEKTVSITYDDLDKEINSAVLLAHELGHAINYIEMMDNQINPDTKINYTDEKFAIDCESKFVKTLSFNDQMASKDRILYHFAKTLFEQKIYTDISTNFEEAYAQSINAVFPTTDTKNPFYVFDTSFINDPCYSTIYSVIYAQTE